jgi:hypothetical protein
MVIVGKIFDIVVIDENNAQIVLKKKHGDKIVPVAVTVWGHWKKRALEEKKLQPRDKIRANLYIKSKLWTGKDGRERYLTDVTFKDIDLLEKYTPSKISQPSMFRTPEGNLIDEDGVIIEEHENKEEDLH